MCAGESELLERMTCGTGGSVGGAGTAPRARYGMVVVMGVRVGLLCAQPYVVCAATALGKCGTLRCGENTTNQLFIQSYQTTRGAEHGIEKTVWVVALATSMAVWK